MGAIRTSRSEAPDPGSGQPYGRGWAAPVSGPSGSARLGPGRNHCVGSDVGGNMSHSLRLTVAALAAVALTPAAAGAASTPFEFQSGPAAAFGNAIAADSAGDVWL